MAPIQFTPKPKKKIWLYFLFGTIILIGIFFIFKPDFNIVKGYFTKPLTLKEIQMPVGEKDEPGLIGFIPKTREIRIESQDYIDNYLNWNFEEINDTHWMATFTIDKTFLADVKVALPYACSNARWSALKEKYIGTSFTNTKVCNDLKNMSNYPLKSNSSMEFSNFKIDINNGNGSFYIIFPEGFKEGEKATFGFGSTQINTGSTSFCTTNGRCLCRDGAGNIHVAFRYSTTSIEYAKSTNNGETWILNNSFYTGAAGNTRQVPSISCDGNNVTITYEDVTADDIMVARSTNNGATWIWSNPVTSSVGVYINVERRGNRIYVVYLDASTDQLVKFFNSSDGGVTWSTPVTIITPDAGYDASIPSLSVDGNGGSTDKIYVMAYNRQTSIRHVFVNSSNSGATWSSPVNLGGTYFIGTETSNSITQNSTNLYASFTEGAVTYFMNSTNGGINWTAGYAIDDDSLAKSVSVTYDNLGNPFVFWGRGYIYTLEDIKFRRYNGTSWGDIGYLTYDDIGNYLPNAKRGYDNNKIEFIWQRSSGGSTQIWYDYISFTGEPHIVGIPGITPQTIYKNSVVNCTALYNGANSGRIDFIYYVNNVIQGSYNASSVTMNDLNRGWANVTLSSTTFVKGDTIICSARAYNGTAYSDWSNSSTITVSNSVPVVTINQTYINGTNSFNITATATDADGLSDISSCLAFIKGDEGNVEDYSQFTWNNQSGSYNSGTGQCTITINITNSGQIVQAKDISSTLVGKDVFRVDENTIYMPGGGGNIFRVNKTNLSLIQSYNLGRSGYTQTTLELSDSYVLVLSGQGTSTAQLMKVNKTDLTVGLLALGSYTVGTNALDSSVTGSDLQAFIGDNRYNLTRADSPTFTNIQSLDYGTGAISTMDINKTSGYIYIGDSIGYVRKLNQSNISDSKWAIDKGTNYWYGNKIDGDVVWYGDQGNYLFIINETSGSTIGSYDYGTGYISEIDVDSEFIYFGGTDMILRKLNKTQARVNNNFTVDNSINVSENINGLRVDGNYVYIAVASGAVYKLDKNFSRKIAVGEEVITKIRFIDSASSNIDTTGNSTVMPSTAEDTAPTYSQNSTNSTLAGTNVLHSLKWTDNTGLSNYIFSFDNCTGTFVNDSLATFSGTTNWSNVTKGINTTIGCTIRWKVYANDSTNQWTESSTYSYLTTATNTCTYSGSGNWLVECSDNCLVTSSVNLGGSNLILNGTGTFKVNANIYNVRTLYQDKRCRRIQSVNKIIA